MPGRLHGFRIASGLQASEAGASQALEIPLSQTPQRSVFLPWQGIPLILPVPGNPRTILPDGTSIP